MNAFRELRVLAAALKWLGLRYASATVRGSARCCVATRLNNANVYLFSIGRITMVSNLVLTG